MALREFTDEGGARWTVWSVSSDALHPATRSEDFLRRFASGWLCFESADGEKRRLIAYPEGWESLSDESLMLLCRKAVPRRPGRSAGREPVGKGGDPTTETGRAADAALVSAELGERRRIDLAPPPEHPRRRRSDRAG